MTEKEKKAFDETMGNFDKTMESFKDIFRGNKS